MTSDRQPPSPDGSPPTSGIRRALRGIFLGTEPEELVPVEHSLRGSGYEPVITRVDGTAGFRHELTRGRYEVVFCSCGDAGFDCTSALAVLRETGTDLPFIVISGNMREDQAAAIMKAGAHDFIRKDQFARLPGAVTREIAEARMRRAHRKVLKELAEASARLAAVFEAAPLAVVELDLAGRVQRWNAAAQRIFGWSAEEVLGSPLPVVPAERRADFGAMCGEVQRGSSFTGVEVRWDGKDCAAVELTLSLAPLPGGLLLIAAIKCDMARLQRRLDRAQHHEAMGQLTSGLAQELHAPLALVHHELDFLGQAFEAMALGLAAQREPAAEVAVAAAAGQGGGQRTLPGGRRVELGFLLIEAPRSLAKARDGVARLDRIVAAMGEAGRPAADGRGLHDLNRAVECTGTIARSEFRHVADLVLDLQPDLPPVACDRAEINYVLLNLLVNAAHAVAESAAEKGRGVITVSTRDDGGEVEILVHDTGPGIPEAARKRIFEPFFTTKPVGRGTGQGLATSRAIAVRHRGSLSFESQEGIGASFILRLPKPRRDGPG